MRQRRWLEAIGDYDAEIRYTIMEKRTLVADDQTRLYQILKKKNCRLVAPNMKAVIATYETDSMESCRDKYLKELVSRLVCASFRYLDRDFSLPLNSRKITEIRSPRGDRCCGALEIENGLVGWRPGRHGRVFLLEMEMVLFLVWMWSVGDFFLFGVEDAQLMNSYADKRRKPLEFEVGDKVMLKVSPWKGVIRVFVNSVRGEIIEIFKMGFDIFLQLSHLLWSSQVFGTTIIGLRLPLPVCVLSGAESFPLNNLERVNSMVD
ncbi:hypothetical protein Tco_0576246 [Tanacetum coccineum]